MSAITIRNIPEDLLAKARALAEHEKRSLNQALIILIEQGLQASFATGLVPKSSLTVETQIKLWEMLAGSWQDKRSTKAIISDIYRKRSPGRKIQYDFD